MIGQNKMANQMRLSSFHVVFNPHLDTNFQLTFGHYPTFILEECRAKCTSVCYVFTILCLLLTMKSR